MNRVALITGITGQDGSYLAELLLRIEEYTVIGLIRRSSTTTTCRINHLLSNPYFQLVEFDMNDSMCNNAILQKYSGFDRIEIYNLAAQSHVQTSFDQPWGTFQTNACSVYGWLETIRQSSHSGKIRFYQAGTSEMFGKVQRTPQNEHTPFYPRSPYGVAKLAAHWACKNYRESYGLFICNGILFNHESERRGDLFVTKKIVKGIVNQSAWPIMLGNLDAKRDWGHAEDYVYGMWLMLQASTPDDYILSSGETHSIREFIEEALDSAGFKEYRWCGDSVWVGDREVLRGNVPEFTRPAEVDILLGDPSKAARELGWVRKVGFKNLIRRMVSHEQESLLRSNQ